MSPRRTVEEALETREMVLDAAFRVARRGAGRFTVDAVAREAGVSKGAVLHHFPSKQVLAVGLAEREIERFERAIEHELSSEPDDSPGRWLRSYIRASFELGAGEPGLNEILLAVAVDSSELVAPFEEKFEFWRRRSEEDGIDPARAAAVRYAVDGVAMAEFFGTSAPEGQAREALRAELLAMATFIDDQA